ncbi:hypothetical protein Bca4012_022136 [Brassica carinata]
MSKKAIGILLDPESQESCGSPSFMSHTLSKDPQPTSGDDDGGDAGRIPLEEWLPITESRNGNVFTATFHLLCSGLGFQVLLLPAAFAALGCCLAVVLSQFPNLNSLFGLSLIGGVMAVAYSTAIWSLPLTRDPQRNHQNNVSYDVKDTSFDNIFNAIGLIAISLRGNNLILEIQGTLPSNSKNPSSKTMWTAVVISHVIIAVCMFLVAIVVYWAYGDKIPATGGPIGNYLKLYEQDYSKRAACFIHITFIINCLCSYPINLMPACDNAEMVYVTKRQKPCSIFVRMMFRVFLGLVCFFVAVGFSFLPYLAVLIGAVALLVTSMYPCFMWISIKQPEKKSLMWLVNVSVGSIGASLSVLLVVASALFLAEKGLHANFFKP